MLTPRELEQIKVALSSSVTINVRGYGQLIDLNNTLVLLDRFTEEESDAAKGDQP